MASNSFTFNTVLKYVTEIHDIKLSEYKFTPAPLSI